MNHTIGQTGLTGLVFLAASVYVNPVAYPSTHTTIQTTDRIYIIESIESRVIFNLRSLATFRITGTATSPEGYIYHDSAAPVNSRVSVLLNTSEITMQNRIYDKLIKGSTFLNIDHYPNITFVSKNIEIDEQGTMNIHGILNIKGVSREEVLMADLVKDETSGNSINFIASTYINRSDYNMNSMKILLSDRVEIVIEVTGHALHD